MLSPWKTIGISLAVAAGVVALVAIAVPLDTLARWTGLAGKSHVLLEVSRQELIDERLDALHDAADAKLRDARIDHVGVDSGDRTFQFRVSNAAEIEKARAVLADLLLPVSSGASSVAELSLDEPEPGLLKYTLTDGGIDYRVDMAASQSVKVIGRRLEQGGITDPTIEREGADRILVEVSGALDPQMLTNLLSLNGRLTLQRVDESVPLEQAMAGQVPAGTSLLYSNGTPPLPYLVENRVIVSGENIETAEALVDEATGQPVVQFAFDQAGARIFGEWTKQNVGQLLAIVVDDQVHSAPRIREPILGGRGQISGDYTMESASEVAVLLRAGALPARLNVIEVGTGRGT